MILSVQIINLATIDGMQKANLGVLPNDIIYIEPIRRIFTESVRDIAPAIGIVTNVVTLFIVIQSLNNLRAVSNQDTRYRRNLESSYSHAPKNHESEVVDFF